MAKRLKAVDPNRNKEIDELIERTGRTQAEIADYLTRRLFRPYSHYHISRMASGNRRITSDEMDALRELEAAPAETPPAAPNITESGDAVPLFGYANAAGATLRINDDTRVGIVPIHPAQQGSRNAYAFIAFGDSAGDRLRHGEVGYAIRNRPPMKGELAVIRLSNGDALVKFYDGQDERTLFASQRNPDKKLSYPLRDVVGLDAVVGVSFGR
jgi:hypothetical protein